MNDAAVVLRARGWSVERIRNYLRSNYINATMSSIEDAIQSALQSDEQSDLFCSEHQCAKNLVDYDDGSRYECPECQRERGEALGLM